MSEHGSVVPGAEPFSATGDGTGVLVVHGFTGNPGSIRPLAEALAEAGFTVEAPRLPGHGTVLDDMVPTTFSDWSGAALAAHDELVARVDQVVVAGLSMGGTLCCWLAARRPVAGLVAINAAVKPQDAALKDMVRDMLAAGEVLAPGIGSDIADPGATETAYEGSPLAPALSMFEALDDLQADLARITCPTLILTSAEDHVVEPVNSDHLAASVAGPVERVSLDRSYHVATLDYDKELIAERVIDFVRKVTAR